MRRLLFVLVALVLCGAACSDDSDSSDPDSTSTTAGADDEGDEPDDGAGDDHEDGDADAPDEPATNSGGPPPANELRLGGAGGTVIVTVDCVDPPPTGVVYFSIEGGDAGATAEVAVNNQTETLKVEADGTGAQVVQTEVTDPSAISIDFGDSEQSGRLIGC